MKSFFSFVFSKSFLINLAVLFVLLFIGIFVALSMLSNYTNHGETYEVPVLLDSNVEEAKVLLEKQGMSLVISDSLFVDEKKPGLVLEQQPKSGSMVKSGRKVFVTICAVNPEMIVMPQLTDVSFRQAISIAQSSGLRIGEVSYEFSEYEDLVLSQKVGGSDAAVGISVLKGSYVDLVVGRRGAGSSVIVPDLLGESVENFGSRMANLGLTIGARIYDESIVEAADSLRARVYRQQPAAGASLEYGGLIDVWLTVDNTLFEVPADDDLEVEF